MIFPSARYCGLPIITFNAKPFARKLIHIIYFTGRCRTCQKWSSNSDRTVLRERTSKHCCGVKDRRALQFAGPIYRHGVMRPEFTGIHTLARFICPSSLLQTSHLRWKQDKFRTSCYKSQPASSTYTTNTSFTEISNLSIVTMVFVHLLMGQFCGFSKQLSSKSLGFTSNAWRTGGYYNPGTIWY
jgi:hypothetical protein